MIHGQKGETMQTYYIFDEHTNTLVGEVLAISIADAEEIAAGTYLDHGMMYAIPCTNF